MKRTTLLLAAPLLILLCAAVILLRGSSYTLSLPVDPSAGDADAYLVHFEQNHEVVRLARRELDGDTLRLTLRSVSEGKAFVDVYAPDGEEIYLDVLYVHAFGILTVNHYFGSASGSAVLPFAVVLYLALLLWYEALRYRSDMRRSLYQYTNIRHLGWLIYVGSLLLGQLPHLLANDSLIDTVKTTLGTASLLSFVALPIAFVVSILVTLSNFRLMRKEGRNWRNMLGMLLGLLVCLGTILPNALSAYLQRVTFVDVHNEQGAALYLEMLVEDTVLVTVTYLECILLSTILLSVKAARRIPAFDKEYILIHGCQLRKDGTPTPLLRGRADRALEFARMQQEATGKPLVFVPSGGKGTDEVISEAASIRNYLLAAGVPEERILLEDRSANTEENMRFSAALIRSVSGSDAPKVAFATTNYHVFRSGILAEQQGLHAEGIGSKTRSYFWVNAFVREFIATLYAERKKHLLVITVMLAVVYAMIGMLYLSNRM
ncbi:MAG: YdcF family protein [Oscillospiraceae bacterium]|nr:YdcF family protein [Oscillospiraceae bacterium]